MDDYIGRRSLGNNTASLYYALLTCNIINSVIARNVTCIILLSRTDYRGEISI